MDQNISSQVIENKSKSQTSSKRRGEKFKEIWRRFKKNKTALLGLVIFTVIVFTAVFSNFIVPYEAVTQQNAVDRLQGPSAEHWFGTDNFGRDLFARVIHAAPTSLYIGIVVSVIALAVGGTLGIAAGYYGGRFDNIIMRFLDMISALPGNLLALVIVAALGANMRNMIISLLVGRIASTARLSRSVSIGISEQEYVEAAKAGGSGDLRIIFKHMVPNASGTLIISTTMGIASVILGAASLSFIGLGVQPPIPEWGALLNSSREFFRPAPHLMIFPGMAILLTSLSINMIGDGLRDSLDPKHKS